eukprot:TRINITY_DN18828_c0_g1_i3.p1 TRINITY_DN18828_c0_g1~~TRINITY_DN18828_c0_g1_i3.p1  ORF type:complete len:303 (-),score=62.92 TRINITY_DN18828_c0_g1_i3:124-1032(-)
MKRGRKSPSETPTQEKRSGKQKNSIQVAVRCRPLNSQERQLGNKNVWRCTGKCVEELEDDGVTLSGKSHAYDNVFGPEITTAEVYERQCKSIVLGSLGGYNGTIFAYGQTSSGKTFTLVGDVGSNPGVTPRALADVFHSVHENRHIEWDVTVSYLEIYNEAVTDLLQTDSHKGTNMHVYEDKVFGPTVRDLTELRVLNLQDAGEPDMSDMAFQMIDQDENGKLTKREVKAFMNGMGGMFLGDALQTMSAQGKKKLIDDVFTQLDEDGDKKISQEEAKAGEGFVQEMVAKMRDSAPSKAEGEL